MARVDADPGGAAAALERERDAALADPGSAAGGLEGAPAQPSLP